MCVHVFIKNIYLRSKEPVGLATKSFKFDSASLAGGGSNSTHMFKELCMVKKKNC